VGCPADFFVTLSTIQKMAELSSVQGTAVCVVVKSEINSNTFSVVYPLSFLFHSIQAAERDEEDEEDFEVDDDDLPLPSLYFEMKVLYETLTNEEEAPNGNSNDIAKTKAFERAFTLLEKIALRLRSSFIFSPNEELDDINTSNIKYLFIDYFRGKLFPKSLTISGSGFDPSQRQRALKKARLCYLAFLTRCDQFKTIFNDLERDCFDMLTGKQKDSGDCCNHDDDEDDDDGDSNQLNVMRNKMKGSFDANKERTNKIERFKYQRDEKRKLGELQSSLMVKKKGKGRNGLNDHTEENDEDDDSDARDREIIYLHLAINDALDEILGINSELTMLDMMLSRHMNSSSFSSRPEGGQEEEGRGGGGGELQDHRVNQSRNQSRHNDGSSGGMSSIVGVGGGGGSIVYDAKDPNRPGLQVTHFNKDNQGAIYSRKEQIKAGVFQPGHRLPTMTLEELAEIEVYIVVLFFKLLLLLLFFSFFSNLNVL
jgi:hypothetical protein